MPSFTFVHAADLHLGAPFRGLDVGASAALASGRSGNLLVEAGYRALANLEATCIEVGAAFLLLAGDVFDDRAGVLRARFALHDMFQRLGQENIAVYLVHGNHDPLSPGPLPVSWPDNVTVFGSEPQTADVVRDGETLALIHGISHARQRETDNLAARLAQACPAGPAPFRIGLVHCSVGGAADGHAPYAPCALGDLSGSGVDYWALGHVHQPGILCRSPWAVYPGSMQGMHTNETGNHGCAVVTVADGRAEVALRPLAPVAWHRLETAVPPEAGHLDDLLDIVVSELEAMAGRLPEVTRTAVVRIVLRGATRLDKLLRQPGCLETLRDRLREEQLPLSGDLPRILVKDVMAATSAERDFSRLAERQDLVGEVLRLAAETGGNPETAQALVRDELRPLFGHHRLKAVLAGDRGYEALPPAELYDAASTLLVSLLEDD